MEHLDSAGLTLAYPKEDIYHAPMPVRQLGSENEADRIKMLSRIDLFSIMTSKEIEDLMFGMPDRVICSIFVFK